ncbi:MAG: aspartate aminotransferase family protein [Deltaproteobacteria bacterium]|nr:aspartate aminotransferase family protein [Deltaproteobacteria bacterium]MBW1995394.1 aspartate aminotransferase family protein [Deltaproteobacteria bacterium]MBW2151364.1 aspartate aminotransferase family protein [Deltaproteobacteria bacterium]
MAKLSGKNGKSSLILCRTSRGVIEKGIPIIIKGEGTRVFDSEGKAYLDLTSGVTRPVHVGHGRKDLAEAVGKQAAELAYFTPMHFTNQPAIELADTLSTITPDTVSNFFFVCDGSEAVESAMKLAKQHHFCRGEKHRFKVISRRGAYHGVTLLALRAMGTVLSMKHTMEPLTPGSVFVESPYCYRCPLHLSYPNCELACARDMRRIIEFEGPDHISAFIGEPIQQGFGALAPPPGYWELIRKICEDYGILLIIDEVICGFGRTGRWFALEHFGIKPDIITMAKGISSGYVPLGAVGCTDDVIDPIDTFEHIHTYANHPVSCAAGVKNIEILKQEKLIERASEIGVYFLESLKSLEEHSIVAEVRGTGLWLGIDFTVNKKTREVFPLDRLWNIVNRAQEKGLIIKLMGQALELAPPLIIEKSEIDEGVKIIQECVAEEEKDMGLA